MKISDLLLTYVFIKGIDELRGKGKKEKGDDFSPIKEPSALIELIIAVFSLIFWGVLTIGAIVLLIIGLRMIF